MIFYMEYVRNFPELRLMPSVKVKMVIYKGDINKYFKENNLVVQKEFNLKGLCLYTDNTIYIMAEDRKDLLVCLLHETTHAVNMYLNIMGVECLDYDNDEIYVHLLEWFQTQVVNFYDGYKKVCKGRKKFNNKRHIQRNSKSRL